MSELTPSPYGDLLAEVKQRIRAAQYEALRAVNQQLIGLYWDIGRLIVERQRGDTWGRSVVGLLARDLQGEFPGLAGFSARNLWRMRDFYQSYSADGKLPPLVAEIGRRGGGLCRRAAAPGGSGGRDLHARRRPGRTGPRGRRRADGLRPRPDARGGHGVAMVETGGDPGHAPARHTYEQQGFRLFPAARYFKKL